MRLTAYEAALLPVDGRYLAAAHTLILLQGYMHLLEEYQAFRTMNPSAGADQWQATMLMVLPEELNTADIPNTKTSHNLSYKLGVGFARLACQVVAWYLDMQSIWLLDDNVHGCWKMDYDTVLQQRGQSVQHQKLLPISLTDMMITVEHQVSSHNVNAQVPIEMLSCWHCLHVISTVHYCSLCLKALLHCQLTHLPSAT